MSPAYNNMDELRAMVAKFRDERDWLRFHTPKNLAQALASEIGELNDLYLWDREPSLEEVREEIADVFIYLLSLSDVTGIDLGQAMIDKLKANEVKYPVEKSRGNDRKYSRI